MGSFETSATKNSADVLSYLEVVRHLVRQIREEVSQGASKRFSVSEFKKIG